MITAQAYEREGFFVASVLLCSHGKASFNFLASVANEYFQSYSLITGNQGRLELLNKEPQTQRLTQ